MTNLDDLNDAAGIKASAEEMAIGMLVQELIESLIELHNKGEMPAYPQDIDRSQYIQRYFDFLRWLGEGAVKI